MEYSYRVQPVRSVSTGGENSRQNRDVSKKWDSTGFLTSADLAARWGMTRETARNHTKAKGFPERVGTPGQVYWWRESDVTEWEKTHSVKSRARRTRVPRYWGQELPLPARIVAA